MNEYELKYIKWQEIAGQMEQDQRKLIDSIRHDEHLTTFEKKKTIIQKNKEYRDKYFAKRKELLGK